MRPNSIPVEIMRGDDDKFYLYNESMGGLLVESSDIQFAPSSSGLPLVSFSSEIEADEYVSKRNGLASGKTIIEMYFNKFGIYWRNGKRFRILIDPKLEKHIRDNIKRGQVPPDDIAGGL